MVAVLLVVWFAGSTFVVRYPFTIDGQDAALRDRGLVLLLALTAIAWYRASSHRTAYLLAFGAVALVLGVESFFFGYGPGGALAAVWWNEKVLSLLMLATCAAGLLTRPAPGRPHPR